MCNNITISFIQSLPSLRIIGERGGEQPFNSLSPLALVVWKPSPSLSLPPSVLLLNWTDCSFNHWSGVWLLCGLPYCGIKEQLTLSLLTLCRASNRCYGINRRASPQIITVYPFYYCSCFSAIFLRAVLFSIKGRSQHDSFHIKCLRTAWIYAKAGSFHPT